MQQGLRCCEDQDATMIRCNDDQMQRGSRCNEDQDATRIKIQQRSRLTSFNMKNTESALFTISSVSPNTDLLMQSWLDACSVGKKSVSKCI